MLRRLTVAGTSALAIVLAGSAPARAQIGVSLSRVGSGARAAGMADAFVAISDDGTAASWNPAGLAQLRQPELSFVYGVSSHGVELSALRSADMRVAYATQRFRYSNASPDFASAALPFSIARKPVTVQVGWHRLYQLGSDITGDVERIAVGGPPGARTTSFRSDRLTGDIDVISVAGAVKLSSRLSLGGSVDWFRGDWQERLMLVEPPAGATPARFLAADFSARVRGHVFTGGLLLGYPSWTAGLVYHSPAWSSYRVHTHANGSNLPERSQDAPSARFRWPRSMGAGVARRLPSRWTLAASVTHDQWTDTLVDRYPGVEGAVNFFDEAPPDLTTTRDTVSLNAGVEHLFVREGTVVPLRFGFGLEPQGGMDPVTRDPVDILLLAAGGGYNTNRLKFDAAVQYRWSSVRATDRVSIDTMLAGGSVRDAEGRVASHEWRIKVSAIYRIQDTEKLRGILRKIFG